MAPATTGQYAQPAHKMEYQIMVPTSVDFNGDREFSIIQEGLANAGVKVTEQSGGDSTAAYAIETGDKCDPSTNPPPATTSSTSPCGTGWRRRIRTSSCRS